MVATSTGPRRIVCLTDETTETLYLLGEQERIVGISGYTCRPAAAREKPKVSAFTTAKIGRILDLEPDLIIGFSNLQADIGQALVRAGKTVLITNQRSVAEILENILLIGRIVGAEAKAVALVNRLQGEMNRIAKSAKRFVHRPRVFFEEWMDPLISGIRWVEELVAVAGGSPIFPKLRFEHDAARRIVSLDAVRDRDPEVIVASWCGRKVNKNTIAARSNWQAMSAVRFGHIYEIKSAYILQPGPAALTEGVRQLHAIFSHIAGMDVEHDISPEAVVDHDLRQHSVRRIPSEQAEIVADLDSL